MPPTDPEIPTTPSTLAEAAPYWLVRCFADALEGRSCENGDYVQCAERKTLEFTEFCAPCAARWWLSLQSDAPAPPSEARPSPQCDPVEAESGHVEFEPVPQNIQRQVETLLKRHPPIIEHKVSFAERVETAIAASAQPTQEPDDLQARLDLAQGLMDDLRESDEQHLATKGSGLTAEERVFAENGGEMSYLVIKFDDGTTTTIMGRMHGIGPQVDAIRRVIREAVSAAETEWLARQAAMRHLAEKFEASFDKIDREAVAAQQLTESVGSGGVMRSLCGNAAVVAGQCGHQPAPSEVCVRCLQRAMSRDKRTASN